MVTRLQKLTFQVLMLCHLSLGYVCAQLPGGTDKPFEVTIIPPSPEASALAKYADIPVSLYSGTPTISIPLYEIKERELSLPVSMNYHGSGNKVETIASRTGLGWTLNAGGLVARTVRGWPDEHSQRGFLYQAQLHDVGDYAQGTPQQQYEWYDAMAEGCLDTEPDLFYFNFAGYTGKFMFNWDGQIQMISGNSIKIEPIGLVVGAVDFIDGWKITVDDGTTFTFQAIETTEVVESYPNFSCALGVNEKNMPQSWFLTEARSANQQSWISFEYENYFQQNRMWSLETQVHNAALSPATPERERLLVNISGKNLKKITTSSGQTILEFSNGPQRTDIEGNANYTLGGLAIKNINNKLIKQWDFNYTYGTGRLTLAKITERGGAIVKPPYEFSYSGSLPAFTSFARDHWGFYNSNSAQTMIPATKALRAGDPDPVELSGADRSPNPSRVLAGMLSQITYPTGGKDILTFESHDYSFEQNDELDKEITIPKSVSGGAPAAGTPPGTVYTDQKNFTLISKTNLELNAFFSYGVVFGSGLYLPSVTLRNSTGAVIYTIAPGGAADPNGDPTYKRISETFYNLPADTYTFTVQVKVPPAGINSVAAELDWQEGTGEITTEIRQGGGVRIARITRVYGNGNPNKVTAYKYRIIEDGRTKSTGSLLESGYLYEKWMQYTVASGSGYTLEDKLLRFSQNRSSLGTTQGSHVGYSHVAVLNGETGENGKSIYHFTSPRDVIDYVLWDIPYPPARSLDYKRGLLLDQSDYQTGSDNPVKKIINTYAYHSAEVPAIKVGFRLPGTGPRGAGHLERYAVASYSTVLGYSRLIESRELMLQPGATPLEILTTSEFNETTHKQIISQSTTNSKGETIVTAFKYPHDYAATTGVIGAMKDRNMANVVIENLVWKKGSGSQVYLLSGIKNTYGLTSNKVTVTGKYSTKITQPVLTTNPFSTAQNLYEARLLFTGYDTYGNLAEHATKDGMKTAYQWGNVGTLPIAKVDHASSRQIFYQGFEEDATASTLEHKTGQRSKHVPGSYSLPSGSKPSFAGNYVLSYWTKSGTSPWSYKEKLFQNYVPGNAIATDAINGYLDEVRVYPQGAQMTTYTYEPLLGVTSMTDPSNVTIHYEYDDLGRLTCIRDQDGNIREWYDYVFRSAIPYALNDQ